MKLRALLKEMDAEVVGGGNPEISSIAWDSRMAESGALFFALPGEATDGNRFIPHAVERGAAAVVSSEPPEDLSVPSVRVPDPRAFMAPVAAKFFGNPSEKLKVAGVTGTNGKTTTTWLIKHILDEVSRPCGMIGTIHYSLGSHDTPAMRTTPESVELQKMLAEMVAARCKACAMEVSSHALTQHRVDSICFAVGVFTNLTQDHLDYHKDMESYFAAKAHMFELLRMTPGGRAVVNLDDRFGHRLLSKFGKKGAPVTYGLGANADFRATKIRFEPSGTSFGLIAKGKEYLVRVPLIGLFNVYNSLAALAACAAMGVEVRSAVAALSRAPQVPGRLQRVPAKRSFQVFVDYAHTPDALENVLKTIRELVPNRILTVFGCGGDRDKAKRPLMGGVAERYSDHTIVTSDNPRGEDPGKIIEDIRKGLKGTGYEIIEDRAAAIHRAVELAEPGDIVLIAGKGHETYQEVRGERSPFDDATVAQWAIAEKRVVME